MTTKMEKKYIPLAEFFQNSTQSEITLTYEAIENINAKVTQLMGDLSKLNMKLAGQAKCLKSNVC